MTLIYYQKPDTNREFNIYRKLWHLLGLLIPLMLYLNPLRLFGIDLPYGSRGPGIVILAACVMLMLFSDALRFHWAFYRTLFYRFFGILMKEEEANRINATVPYLFANLMLFLFFSDVIVVLASIFLMIGDPMAAWIGTRYGRIRFWNHKSFEGMSGFAISGFIGGAAFLLFHTLFSQNSDAHFLLFTNGSWNAPLLVSLLAGVSVAAIAELVSNNRFFGLLDDNVIVPLTGALGFALFSLWAGASPDAMLINPLHVWAELVG